VRVKTNPSIIFFLGIALIGSAVRVPPTRAQQAVQFPATPKRAVTDEYHGVKVIDEYRWLEDSADPAVKRWVEEQNKLSRSVLDKNPARAMIAARLKDLYADRPAIHYSFYQRGMFFAMKLQPGKNQPLLVMLKSPDDLSSERVVLDPNVLNPKGTTAVDFYVPSLDGRFVAVSLSESGSEDGSAHVYETATGRKLPDVIQRVQYPTAGGSMEWNKDGSGFYYTRYPRSGERPPEDLTFYQQVYFHRLGTPTSEDTYVIGKEFPRIAEIRLSTSEDARHLLASVANGDGGEFAHYLLGPSGTWTQLTQFSDQVKSVLFGPNGTLYLLSVGGAPRGKILSVPLDDPKLSGAKVVVPEGDATIESFTPAATRTRQPRSGSRRC
jgi:prolyl oligopeptidase